MAAPTWAEVWTQIANAIDPINELDLFANANASNWLGMEDTFTQALEGEYAVNAAAELAKIRAKLSEALSPASVRAVLLPFVYELGRVIAAAETDLATLLYRLRTYMDANSYSINSRGITYGSLSAGGSNVGSGTIYRLTVDEDNYRIEGCHVEARTAEVVADQNQTIEHEEIFLFRGVEAERDFLQVLGSGAQNVRRIAAVSARTSQTWLKNPSFEQLSGTQPSASTPVAPASTTSITGWTLDATTNVTVGIDTPAPYRDFQGISTPYWVRFNGNAHITQTINANARGKFNPNVPYHLQVAIYRESSCDGTLSITLGSVTRNVTMTTLNNSAWNVVTWQSSPGQNNWYRNFQGADMVVKIQLASRTTGSIYIDDVVLAPFARFDGLWYLPVGGATAFLLDDVFTWTDSESTRGKISYWWWRAGLGHLPSDNGGTETIADP